MAPRPMRLTSRSPSFAVFTVWSSGGRGGGGGAGQSTRRAPSRRTISGSRWSKNCDVAVSRVGDLVMSSSVSAKSKTSKFSRHPLRVDRLGDDDDAALDHPAQHDLGDRLAVLLADPGQQRVGEQPVLALGERAPRLDLHPLGRDELLVVGRWWNGWVSIWLTAGVISLLMTRSMSRSGGKFDTPIARARPSGRSSPSRATGRSSRRRAGGSGTGRRSRGRACCSECVERAPWCSPRRRPGPTAWW